MGSSSLNNSDSPLGKYLLYAIGEIVLVVIGILIALQINNWNEERKEQKVVEELYGNLVASLRTDSIALIDVLAMTRLSLDRQGLIISSSPDEILADHTDAEIRQMVRDIWGGIYSLYPKMGIYNQILSSNLMKLIESEEIKDGLREYYDFRCTRYRSLDPIVDEKYHLFFQNFMSEELGMLNFDHFDKKVDPPNFTVINIDNLKIESRKLYDITFGIYGILQEFEEDIHTLLMLIQEELS